MFLKAVNDFENSTTKVFLLDCVPYDETVLHPVDFVHDVWNKELKYPIYTYVTQTEFDTLVVWLGGFYV